MAMTSKTDREQARRELVTMIEVVNGEPTPDNDVDRGHLLAACTGLGMALVDYFLAEAAAKVGDPRSRHRYLRALTDLLDTPPDGSSWRDRARLSCFRLLFSSAAMHLTVQRQREEMGLEAAPS